MKNNSNPNNNEPEEPPPDVALREQIERRAYHIWKASGGGHGEHLRHWLQAESEMLKAQRQDQAERAASHKTNASAKRPTLPEPNETSPTK